VWVSEVVILVRIDSAANALSSAKALRTYHVEGLRAVVSAGLQRGSQKPLPAISWTPTSASWCWGPHFPVRKRQATTGWRGALQRLRQLQRFGVKFQLDADLDQAGSPGGQPQRARIAPPKACQQILCAGPGGCTPGPPVKWKNSKWLIFWIGGSFHQGHCCLTGQAAERASSIPANRRSRIPLLRVGESGRSSSPSLRRMRNSPSRFRSSSPGDGCTCRRLVAHPAAVSRAQRCFVMAAQTGFFSGSNITGNCCRPRAHSVWRSSHTQGLCSAPLDAVDLPATRLCYYRK